ncbi:unnamed protein product [Mortierella alpina]
MSGIKTSKHSITIFDISLLVDSICSSLDRHDIVRCRRVCKAWNAAFAVNSWRTVWLLKKGTPVPHTTRPATATGLIRSNAHWIRSLGLSLFDSTFQGSTCTNLEGLGCSYDGGPGAETNTDESSLALLWQNRGLRALGFSLYESHVRRHVLPNLPRLIQLRTLFITLNCTFRSDFSLFLDILQLLPPSLLELTVATNHISGWKQSDEEVTAPSSTWKPCAIRLLDIRSFNSNIHLLIPFVEACPRLRCLELPIGSHADELLTTLATSCPQLSWLKLKSVPRSVSSDYNDFRNMPQRFTDLSLNIYNDMLNNVIRTVLARSTATLQELCLENAQGHRGRDVPLILRSCPELRVLRVHAFRDNMRREPMASTPLPFLVEQPWVCTHLRELSLTVTDVRDPSSDLAVEEVERENLARLLLRLHHQIQVLEEFSPSCRLEFYGPSFTQMPLESWLPYMDGQMTVKDLRRLGLR